MTDNQIILNLSRNLAIKPCFFFTYPSFFDAVGYHDNAFNSLFPDHPPEIIDCGRQRALSGNVLFVVLVALRRD